jgi:hypothetical protein
MNSGTPAPGGGLARARRTSARRDPRYLIVISVALMRSSLRAFHVIRLLAP